MSLREVLPSKRRFRRLASRQPANGWIPKEFFSESSLSVGGTGVLEAVLGRACQRLGVDRVAVYQTDEQSGKFWCVISIGLSADYLQDVAGHDEQFSRAWAKLIESPLSVSDVLSDLRTAMVRERLVAEGIKSILVLPFGLGRRLAGALAIYCDRVRHWSRSEAALASALSGQVALALENWRLGQFVEEAEQTRESFLSRASHELRTPLTSIIAYTQYLERYLANRPGSDFELRQLRVIEAQAMRMSRLVQDIVDVRMLESGELRLKKEPLDLRELIREAVGEVAPIASDHSLDIVVPGEFPQVLGDNLRLRQVISKLVANAIKYSPDGGNVVVELTSRDDYAVVAVRDHGIGINEKHQPFIFDRFYQAESDPRSRRFGGMGLGLYTSKAIIEAHGGQMWVESREGEGSTFWFSLPLSSARGEKGG